MALESGLITGRNFTYVDASNQMVEKPALSGSYTVAWEKPIMAWRDNYGTDAETISEWAIDTTSSGGYDPDLNAYPWYRRNAVIWYFQCALEFDRGTWNISSVKYNYTPVPMRTRPFKRSVLYHGVRGW